MIKLKSKFYGWREIKHEDALCWAKSMLRAITTCQTDEERLEIINGRFEGVKFVLEDLK